MCSAAFDMIHCDIWGPFHAPTHLGHKYFLSIVDDFIGFAWVHLLKSKSKASLMLQKFITWVKTQFGVLVKCLRTDNVKELQLADFLFNKGIDHQFLVWRGHNKTLWLNEHINIS